LHRLVEVGEREIDVAAAAIGDGRDCRSQRVLRIEFDGLREIAMARSSSPLPRNARPRL